MADTVTEPTLPGMPVPEPLWAVHVQGSDDIIPQPSRRDAELFKSLLDDLEVKNAARPMYPKFAAEIVPWPGTRKEHAEALRCEAEEN